jgi:putative transposase
VRFAFIQEQRVAFPVTVMCKVLDVSSSGFYAFVRGDKATDSDCNDRKTMDEIRSIHAQSRSTYGVRRVLAELRSRGHHIGLKRVRRLMRLAGLDVRCKRRFRATTDSKHNHPVADNLVHRNFETKAPDQVWVGDITYIPTDEGWLYLATLVDLFSRRVVGWAMSDRIDRNLTLDALRDAVDKRDPSAGLIHHTDRGSQYACSDYRAALTAHGMVCSMSRKGDCWDNAVAETSFASLKAELVYWERYRTRQQARDSISSYLEDFYNRTRRHSTLRYLSPIEFELAYQAMDAAA